MKKTTISTLINQYTDVLDESIIEKLTDLRSHLNPYTNQVEELHQALFSEETDFMCDDNVDAKTRRQGINPMNEEYIQKVATKRERLNVSQLSSSGEAVDNSSKLFCKSVISASGNYSEKRNNQKEILYVDMDNVLVDFQSGIDTLTKEKLVEYEGRMDDVPGIFSKMKPMKGAVESFKWLAERFDTYILSTAPFDNPSAWTDKLLWVKEHIGDPARKRLILSHHKNLNQGQYIIDDRTKRGVDEFEGMHIHFGTPDFPDWKSVIKYFK